MRQLSMTTELSEQIDTVKQWLIGKEAVYVEQVWRSALGKKITDYDQRAAVRLSIILTTYCGWSRSGIRERVDGVQKWMYCRGKDSATFGDVLG
jgi:exo-beta-1,3-glucanase (GH17 family)